MIGGELTIQLVALRLFAGLIIATVQGATIAALAVMLGDRGVQHDGRLTVNTLRHVDLVGLVSMMISGFGWSRPVAVETAQLRIGRWGHMVIVLASSAVLLALGYLLLLLVVPMLTLLPYTAGLTAAAFIRVAARLCVWTALLALIPVPPLAGAQFLAALGIRLPPVTGTIIGWVLLIISALGFTRMILTPLYEVIAPAILGSAALIG